MEFTQKQARKHSLETQAAQELLERRQRGPGALEMAEGSFYRWVLLLRLHAAAAAAAAVVAAAASEPSKLLI